MASQHGLPTAEFVRFLKNRELSQFYASVFIKGLARGSILIFVPFYLLQLGYSLREVAILYIAKFVLFMLASPIGMWSNSRFGIKKTMLAGDVFLIAYLASVVFLAQKPEIFFLLAILYGLASGLYLSAYHIEFTHAKDKKHEGEEISIGKVLIIISQAMAPLVGAIIIDRFSYEINFIVAATMIMLSLMPLFLSADFKTKTYRFSIQRLKNADSKRKALAYTGFGILQLGNDIFWPLFMYMVLQDVLDVGVLVSISTVLTIFGVLWYGRKVDGGVRQGLVAGVWAHAPSWLVRLMVTNTLGVALANFYSNFSYHLLDVAYEKVIYSDASASSDWSNYFLFRELYVTIGRVALLAVLLVFGSLELTFVVCFFMTFSYLALLKKIPKT
jgi:MFS family permease